MRVAIIANGKCKQFFSKLDCDLYENLSHQKVENLLENRAALVCSLEGAGFAQTAIHGLKVLLSDTGASFVPSMTFCVREMSAHLPVRLLTLSERSKRLSRQTREI